MTLGHREAKGLTTNDYLSLTINGMLSDFYIVSFSQRYGMISITISILPMSKVRFKNIK